MDTVLYAVFNVLPVRFKEFFSRNTTPAIQFTDECDIFFQENLQSAFDFLSEY